jgi:hypothetical protein
MCEDRLTALGESESLEELQDVAGKAVPTIEQGTRS